VGREPAPLRERLAAHLPFGVYLGWITIATIADVAVTLVALNWGGSGIAAETWSLIITVVALLVAMAVIVARKDAGHGLVIIWALAGIAVKQMPHPAILMALEAGIAIIAVALMGTVLISRLWHRPEQGSKHWSSKRY